MRELLIATTNAGKIAEIKAFLSTMPFTLLSLSDLAETIVSPVEDTGTVAGNALLKARYYAAKTGKLTLADDAGFFIEALGGWPGVDAALVPGTADEKMTTVLNRLHSEQITNRSAYWEATMALVDPDSKVELLAHGKTDGEITLEKQGTGGHGYDPIFLVPELGKTYAELTIHEKNAISHRGKALIRIKHHLQNTYVAKHIVVPCGLIIKDGKLLMNKRNDPHRPEYHDKWEFPGGKVELYETMHQNMVREIAEEVGYEVEILKMLQHITVESQVQKTYAYQVFLVPYVCRITGGELKPSDDEVLDTAWFDLDDVLNHDLLGENARMYTAFLPELKEVAKEFGL